MKVYEILFTDGDDRAAVTVAATLPEHRADWVARGIANERFAPRRAFASRPYGCTGMAYNVHFGGENACPIHGEG